MNDKLVVQKIKETLLKEYPVSERDNDFIYKGNRMYSVNEVLKELDSLESSVTKYMIKLAKKINGNNIAMNKNPLL
jgi:hypothetical protein